MVYRKDGFTLYARAVPLKNGRDRTLYFFARSKPESGQPADLPEGYEVVTTERTGLPVLRRTDGTGTQPPKKAATEKPQKKTTKKAAPRKSTKKAAKKATKKATKKTAPKSEGKKGSATKGSSARGARKKSREKRASRPRGDRG